MAEQINKETFSRAVEDVLANYSENAIQKAVADFEVELRRRVGEVAMNVSNYYDVEKQTDRLIISVRVGTDVRK